MNLGLDAIAVEKAAGIGGALFPLILMVVLVVVVGVIVDKRKK